MALSDKQAIDELLHAQTHIWNHMLNFINSFSLKCAVQLEIPDIIHKHGKPMPLSDLVEALSINKAKSNNLQRLMRLLAHSGFFIEDSEGYVLTPSGEHLRKDHPFATAHLLLNMLDPISTDPWHQFSNWFKSEKNVSPFESFHGKPLWEVTSVTPDYNESFHEGMAGDSRMVAACLLKKHKEVFEGVDSLVDIGGGTGITSRDIAKEFPNMSCKVFDLPHVVDGLKGTTNLSFVGGDMFQTLPKANAFLFKWLLKDWPDHKCVEILRNCKQYLSPKGKVIIIDTVFDKKKEDVETQLYYDMVLMALNNGKERSEEEWAKNITDAGFKSYKITQVHSMISIIEVYP